MSSRLRDFQGLTNGLLIVFRSGIESQTKNADRYVRSFVIPDVEYFKMQMENTLGERLQKTPVENLADAGKKVQTLVGQTKTFLDTSDTFNRFFGSQKRALHLSIIQQPSIRIQSRLPVVYRRSYSASATDTIGAHRKHNVTESSQTQTHTTKPHIKVSTANVAKFRHQVNW